MLHTLAVIPCIGKKVDWRRKGLVKFRGKTLLSIAVEKAKKVTRWVAIASDDPSVLRHAKRYGAYAIKVRRTKYVSSMSDGLLYEACLRWMARHVDAQFDILLMVNWETPLSTVSDLKKLVALDDDHFSDSAATVCVEEGKYWRDVNGYSQVIMPWEPLSCDAKIGYAIWIGDFVMCHHFRVGRHKLVNVPRIRAQRILEKEDLKLLEGK